MGISYIAALLGIASRTLLPYLLTLKDKPDTKFDRKFLVPAILSVVINLLLAPFVFESLPTGADFIAAYIIGWGASDIGREAMKFVGGSVASLKGLK